MKAVIEKCQECGKREELHWIPEVNEALVKYQLCFKCNFWREKVLIKDEPRVARIDGRHYQVGQEHAPGYGGFRGFGGTGFTIVFDDGRKVKTTNLWHQGTIPKHFKERLPDNAHFEYGEKKGGSIYDRQKDSNTGTQ